MGSFIALRLASREDAAELAILADIAASGLTSLIWYAEAVKHGSETPMERGRMRMRESGDFGGYSNAVLAETQGEIMGAAIGYPLTDAFLNFRLDHVLLEPVMALQRKVIGTWFIETLSVYSHRRGSGIGQRLLKDQIQRAGNRAVSLITAANNEAALSLYERNGFSELARMDAAPVFENPSKHAWVLMIRAKD